MIATHHEQFTLAYKYPGPLKRNLSPSIISCTEFYDILLNTKRKLTFLQLLAIIGFLINEQYISLRSILVGSSQGLN